MTTSTATWDYEGYWNTVLGVGNASRIVRESDLSGATERDLDEWLGHGEAEAWSAGGNDGDLPEEWASYHQTALAALVEAAAIYVVWGSGASSACGDLDSAPDLLAWTPWAGRELVEDEWVVAFGGDPSDLDRDAAVIGYRRLADHEIRDWRSRSRSGRTEED